MPKKRRFDNKNYYIHVPADTHKMPGAYFRLGAYSDREMATLEHEPRRKTYYPEDHLSDCSTEEQVSGHGIMLSCDGRMLLRSHGKLIVHADNDIDLRTNANLTANIREKLTINTGNAVAVTADDSITLKTNNAKTITINADDGMGSIKSVGNKGLEEWLGINWTISRDDSYSIKLGNAITLTRNMSLDMKLALAIEFKIAFSLSIQLQANIVLNLGFKFDYNVFLWAGTKAKYEIKGTHIENAILAVKTGAVSAKNTVTDAGRSAISSVQELLSNRFSGVEAERATIRSRSSSITSDLNGLTIMP